MGAPMPANHFGSKGRRAARHPKNAAVRIANQSHFPVANRSHYPYITLVEKDSHMVVCVCNAIRESQLRDVARDGQLRCAKAAYAQLGRKPKCGQCLPFARNIISDVAATA